ncbi:MALT paracaspase 2 isoform X3 [Nerophis ophidion]|uniref:MALT paracaspase 2 isoform X3 n=1 Tax=Nerophis ophidion TaxID=159077 RepID=UPI002ADF07F6|nr:MALT paracaspase 2 isoform X3 [Nerophis ophidion]
MDKSTAGIGDLEKEVMDMLGRMLDNNTCGWRQLAAAASEQPKLLCSEMDVTSCSLQVLSATGSPGRSLLALLADRSCSQLFLLQCLKKIGHQGALQLLTATERQQIRVTVQPNSLQAAAGSTVVLTCRASGPPALTYQWFKGKEEVLEATGSTPELVLCPLGPQHQGSYICRVNHGDTCCFSQWARVRLVYSPVGTGPGTLFSGSASGLRVIYQPQCQTLSEGDTLLLECNAVANPPPQYQWYHNSAPMPNKTRLLKIASVTTAHRGQYRCKVFNLYHEVWSDLATVSVGPTSITDLSWVEVDRGSESNELERSVSSAGSHPPQPQSKNFYATDKVALLIGNLNYRHLNELCAPMADVHELSNLLRQMDFKVVSLLDLNLQEMHSAVTEFLLLLGKGVYDMGRFEITRGRQALELRSNLSERRSLTDKIQTLECSAAYSARNLQWAVAHALPKSRFIHFDCGVKVQLGFAAEFSNVMVIYTRILDKPKEIGSCSAQLTDFPEDVDIDLKKSNQETLLEAGSLLMIKEHVSSPHFPTLYTHIQSLQRLKKELTFSLCLHYVYSDMEEEVTEKRAVTVGKPLVSKLNLYEPRPAASVSLDSGSVSELSSLSEDFASNTWSLFTPANADKFKDNNNVHSY